LHCFAQRGDVFAVVKGQAWEMEHVVLILLFWLKRKSYAHVTLT
jgi:hypothetical protein